MKKKEGFTLIELLAVILILGIIALIAIPSVTKIIDESKKGSYKTSVENLLRAVEQECQMSQLKGEQVSKTYTFKDGKVDKPLNIKGDLPKTGKIVVDNNCNLNVSLSDGTYLARKGYDSDNINVDKANLCVRATSLHVEECNYTSEDNKGCYVTGYSIDGVKGTTTITYGNEKTEKGKLNSGDAFDCDVNGDGLYDSETERFYYVSDYYNATLTEEDKFENDKAVLIYYNNTAYDSNGNLLPDNTATSQIAYYADASENYHGPSTAITNLPLRTQWKNLNLITGIRAIVGKDGETSTKGGTLPNAFDYSNYAARLLTAQELSAGCNNLKIGSNLDGELEVCDYLLENTRYSNDSIEINGYFLETPYVGRANDVWFVRGNYCYIAYSSADNYSFKGARPVITVLKTDISY